MRRTSNATAYLLFLSLLPGISTAQGVVTARAHYQQVLATAQATAADVELLVVGPGEVDEHGKRHNWSYYFESASLHRILQFAYEQDDGSVTRVLPVNAQDLPVALHGGMTPIPTSWVDSDVALAEADANGGNDYRATGDIDNYHVDMVLLPPEDGGRNALFKEAAWLVTYTGEPGDVSIPVDAATGTFLDFGVPTARRFLHEADSLSQALADDLELVLVGSGLTRPDGTAPVWTYYYRSPSESKFYGVLALEGRLGIVQQPIGESGILHMEMPSLPPEWLDSDEAVAAAEQSGGSAFRQTHAEWNIEANVGTWESGLPQWQLNYHSPSGSENFTVDAATGDAVMAHYALTDVIARAHQEQQDAELIVIEASNVDLEGRAKSWSYIFKSKSAPDIFGVIVLGGTVADQIKPIGLNGPLDIFMPPLPDDWLESDSAVAIGEVIGGAAFRAGRMDVHLDLTLRWFQTRFTLSHGLGSRPIYLLTYTAGQNEDSFALDAQAGDYATLPKTTARENLILLADAADVMNMPDDLELMHLGAVQVDTAGRAVVWTYAYRSAGTQDEYKLLSLGTMIVAPPEIQEDITPDMDPLRDGWMDSSVAIDSLEALGGRTFRETHGDWEVTLDLHQSGGGVFWNAYYGSRFGEDHFFLDASYYTVADEPDLVPAKMYDLVSYPNPFSGSTTITFSLPKPAVTEIVVYDVLGRKRLTVEKGFLAAGSYVVRSELSQLEAGAYFVVLRAGDLVRTVRLVKAE